MKNRDNFIRKKFIQPQTFLWLFCCLCLLSMALIFVSVAAYTGLRGDDYGVLWSYSSGKDTIDIVQQAFESAERLYRTSGGYVVSYFVNCLAVFGIVEGKISLTIFMIVGSLFLLGAISFFVSAVGYSTGMFRGRKESAIALFLVMSSWYLFLDVQKWREINTWLTGYNGYALPVALALISAGLMCRNSSAGVVRIAGTTVLAFIASGGSLQITGVYCYLLLVILLVKAFQKKAKPADWIAFSGAFMGAVLNVAAPGNYLRRLSIDSTGFHPGIALPFIINHADDAIISVVQTPFAWTIFLGILILGIKSFDRFQQKSAHLLLLILACLGAPYISTAPVCLGYGGGYFPNRCQWVTTLTIDISLLCVVYVLGILIGRLLTQQKRNLVRKVVLAGAIVSTVFGVVMLSTQSALYSTALHLVDGTVTAYVQSVKDLENLFEDSEGKDVVVTKRLEEIEEIYPLVLRDDPQSYDNQLLVNFYHLKSLTYTPTW